jgi:hypothetical protein
MQVLSSLRGVCKPPIQLVILVLIHTTTTRQTARAKLLQLELYKLATKQEQQQAKQEDNKVSARGDL